MKNSTKIATGAGITGLGALVALTPRYIFPVCEYHGVRMEMMGKSFSMSCYYTAHASMVVGILIALIGIAVIISRPDSLRSLALVLAGAGAAVILIPTVFFPICHNPDMHCNHGTQPMLIVLGVTTLLTSGFLALASGKTVPSMNQVSEAAA